MVWERGLPTAELHWPALPTGDYTLLLQGPRFSNHRQPAVVLATFTLPAGAQRALQVELPPAPEATAGATRGVRLFTRQARPSEIQDFTLRRWWGEESRSVEATLTAVSGGTVVEVPAGCEAGAHFLLTTDRTVAAARLEVADACRRSLDLTLFPRAELTGQILAPDDLLLPAAGRLRLDRCPSDPSSPARPLLEVPFSVHSQGRFAGPAASGCLQVSLQIGEFPALALAQVDIKRGQTLDLGRHRLEHGGTLLARVVSADDGRPLDGGRGAGGRGRGRRSGGVRGLSTPALPAAPGAADPGRRLEPFPGLPAGTYNLLLRPEHQRWPGLSRAFEIRTHEETVLEDVAAPSPSSLTVETVPTRRLEEELTALEVNAHSGDPDSPEAKGVTLTEKVEEHGLAAFSEIPPGTWWLQAVASLRGGATFPLTGGQPTEEQIERVARAGFRSIVNLRTEGENGGWDEEPRVTELGMRYISLPIDGEGLTVENARKLAEVVGDPELYPMFLHCGSGNRVGALFAMKAFHLRRGGRRGRPRHRPHSGPHRPRAEGPGAAGRRRLLIEISALPPSCRQPRRRRPAAR